MSAPRRTRFEWPAADRRCSRPRARSCDCFSGRSSAVADSAACALFLSGVQKCKRTQPRRRLGSRSQEFHGLVNAWLLLAFLEASLDAPREFVVGALAGAPALGWTIAL